MSVLALTMGDPAGIGPDVTLQSWLSRGDYHLPNFACIADPLLFEERARQLQFSVPIARIDALEEVPALFDDYLPVLPLGGDQIDVLPGRANAASAGKITGSIEKAVSLVYSGEVSGVVTCPINKAVLYSAGFSHPGHTEFLGALARDRGDRATPVMMLVGEGLRVVPATIHIPLKDVVQKLSTELILETLKIMTRDLENSFALPSPHIAVTGVNPHAGEDGALGVEDREIISPAIERAQRAGLNVSGPHPADTLFHESRRGSYDAVLAMYHDQALIPVKTLAFDKGVNVTLGLPFVRTSPDHGTAYEIAGTGKASPRSLIEALKLAHSMAMTRARNL